MSLTYAHAMSSVNFRTRDDTRFKGKTDQQIIADLTLYATQPVTLEGSRTIASVVSHAGASERCRGFLSQAFDAMQAVNPTVTEERVAGWQELIRRNDKAGLRAELHS